MFIDMVIVLVGKFSRQFKRQFKRQFSRRCSSGIIDAFISTDAALPGQTSSSGARHNSSPAPAFNAQGSSA